MHLKLIIKEIKIKEGDEMENVIDLVQSISILLLAICIFALNKSRRIDSLWLIIEE